MSDQVKMLMEMDEANKALDKAIDSGDAQLGNGNKFLLCYYYKH